MTVFVGIFITLVVINVLLLIFSNSLRYPTVKKEKSHKAPASKSPVYPIEVSDTKYPEAV